MASSARRWNIVATSIGVAIAAGLSAGTAFAVTAAREAGPTTTIRACVGPGNVLRLVSAGESCGQG